MNTTVKNEKTVATVTQTPNVASILADARKANPNGSVLVDDLEKNLKSLTRSEIIEQARALGSGFFLKVGRKGAKSEILYGQVAKDFLANRANPSKSPRKKIENPAPAPAPKSNVGFNYNLKINVGENETNLPIRFELAAAA